MSRCLALTCGGTSFISAFLLIVDCSRLDHPTHPSPGTDDDDANDDDDGKLRVVPFDARFLSSKHSKDRLWSSQSRHFTALPHSRSFLPPLAFRSARRPNPTYAITSRPISQASSPSTRSPIMTPSLSWTAKFWFLVLALALCSVSVVNADDHLKPRSVWSRRHRAPIRRQGLSGGSYHPPILIHLPVVCVSKHSEHCSSFLRIPKIHLPGAATHSAGSDLHC